MRATVSVRRTAFLAALIFANFTIANAQVDSSYRIAKGTKLTLSMDVEINSSSAAKNDTFVARLSESYSLDGVVLLPKGTKFEGTVIDAQAAAAGSRDGKLNVLIDKFWVGNEIRRTVSATTVTKFKPESRRTLDILSFAGGTLAGAFIGYAAKPNGGALIGAAVGAGVGGGTLAVRKGRELRIKQGQKFEIELTEDLLLPAMEY
ncbi:MAG TPA: hypothetical protein PKA82_09755 [Pyrinomonadaceae bacterium]|nr:hypothetical protein [Pyrinomonadaceae bacterium]